MVGCPRRGTTHRRGRRTTITKERRQMTAWTSEELAEIGAAEELEIASVRRDGTLRDPVTIWVVPYGDSLYVRSVNGRDAAWFRGTQVRHEGHIQAGGVDKDVAFVVT